MQDRKTCYTDLGGPPQFGEVCLSVEQKAFYEGLNTAILSVIQSLPQSVQIDSLLALTRHLKLSLGKDLDLLKGFHAPSWSILYWVAAGFYPRRRIPLEDTGPYRTVHAIAMLLHLWDDHLNDGELPASHLTVLIRSQMWMIFRQSLDELTHLNDSDAAFARRCLDGYYQSIRSSKSIASLDAYCGQFKEQMSLGYIAPVLLSRRMTADADVADCVQSALGSFGCAWRLLDDLHDIPVDMQTNTRSAVYVCLPDRVKQLWDQPESDPHLDKGRGNAIMGAIASEGLIERMVGRICAELDAATTHAVSAGLSGYADELQMLAAPLRKPR